MGDGRRYTPDIFNLDDIDDIDITSPTIYDHLEYDGTNWVNVQNLTLADGSTIGIASDTDLLTLTSGVLTVAGKVFAKQNIDPAGQSDVSLGWDADTGFFSEFFTASDTEVIHGVVNGVLFQDWRDTDGAYTISLKQDTIISSGNDLTLDSGDLTMTGILTVTGEAHIDRIKINQQAIRVTTNNGLVFRPNNDEANSLFFSSDQTDFTFGSNGTSNLTIAPDNNLILTPGGGDLDVTSTQFNVSSTTDTVGIGTVASSNALLRASASVSKAVDFFAFDGIASIIPTAASLNFGGLKYEANIVGASSSNIDNHYGIFVTASAGLGNYTGTITNMYAGRLFASLYGGDVTNLYGLDIRVPGTVKGSTQVNKWGLHIGDVAGATTLNWAIASDGGNSYHVGNLRLGDTTVPTDTLEVLGTARFGDDTNQTYIESDGTVRFDGTATVWKDINMGAAVLSRPAASQPTEGNFLDEGGGDTGITTLAYAIGEKASGSVEMQHDYKEGSNITFHVHWQGIAAPAGGTDNVQWRLTYVFFRDGTTLDAATIIDTTDTAIDTQYKCYTSRFAAIDCSTAGNNGSGVTIEDQFIFTLERVAATSDDYAGDALVATVGVHYEQDTVGSRTISTK